MIFYLHDLLGWLLCAASFAIPVLSSSVRKNQSLALACWLTLIFHQCAAVVDCYFFPIPGAAADALFFEYQAEKMQVSQIHEPYPLILHFIYECVGASHFLGCELSIIAYAFALLCFIELAIWLRLTHIIPLVIVFGVFPSALFHESVTMRESFQLLGVLSSAWLLTRIRDQPLRVSRLAPFFIAVLLTTRLHQGIAIYSVILIFFGLYWAYRDANLRESSIAPLALMSGFAFILIVGVSLASNSSALSSLLSGDAFTYAANYRKGINVSRANYGVELDARSPAQFVLSMPVIFVMYMFAPFPWQVSGLTDLYALTESLFRLCLLLGTAFGYKRADPDKRRKLQLLVVLFVVLEFLWAMGCVNWGQAIRHRVIAFGFFLLLGGETVLDEVSVYAPSLVGSANAEQPHR